MGESLGQILDEVRGRLGSLRGRADAGHRELIEAVDMVVEALEAVGRVVESHAEALRRGYRRPGSPPP